MISLPGTGTPTTLSSLLAVAIEAARAAGEVALRHLGSASFELKSDHSIVTAADRECEAVARAGLAMTRIPVLGEETATGNAVAGLADLEAAWVVDPIDGTASFAAGLPLFGVSIGLLERGKPVLGAFYLPRTDELYAVDRMGQGFYGSRTIAGCLTPETLDERTFFCATSDAHHRHRVDFPGKVRSLGSTALHVALVARGAAMGAMLKPAVWDVAAVAPLLERAGGGFFDLDTGAPLDFVKWVQAGGPERDLLACSPLSLAPLRRFVRKKT